MPKLINNALLTTIRSAANDFLTDTCTISKAIRVRNDRGQVEDGWEIQATVSCRVIKAGSQMSDATMPVNLRETMEDEHRLAIPYGTPIDVDYKVRLGGASYYADDWYVVRLETELTDEVFHHAIISRRRGQ